MNHRGQATFDAIIAVSGMLILFAAAATLSSAVRAHAAGFVADEQAFSRSHECAAIGNALGILGVAPQPGTRFSCHAEQFRISGPEQKHPLPVIAQEVTEQQAGNQRNVNVRAYAHYR